MPQMSRGKKELDCKRHGGYLFGGRGQGFFGGLDRPPTLTAPAMYEN